MHKKTKVHDAIKPEVSFCTLQHRIVSQVKVKGIKEFKRVNLLAYKMRLHYNLIALILSLCSVGPSIYTNTKLISYFKQQIIIKFPTRMEIKWMSCIR